ncbi:o-succinylbenzoate synthase [Thalassobacillus devorans]|uniref:o-succinylbenzoate synthase n=1 Tax=Thalassobacillus devorans TaxID=279813 RepID=UPI000A1C8A6A|nr:o-succinylbenzoate synthase [Thalassobacillus devorans]
MKIDKVKLYKLKMPLKWPFETSFGRLTDKEFIILKAYGDGAEGYGESASLPFPVYNEETTGTVWYMLKKFLLPKLFEQKEVGHPEEISELFKPIRRNYMAKATLEGAVWDLYSKQRGLPLSEVLGGTKTEIDVGVSIGIEPTVAEVLQKVDRFMKEGYKKIKVKIKPGFDIEPIMAIRKEFGEDVPLMADANSAYSLDQINLLKELDQFNLMMIEQPLSHDDIIDHAKLQRLISTPVCLDESIHSLEDAKKAVELGSCKIINIKIGRVGGLTEAKKIHDFCNENGIPVWCGGMLEAGVGRAHNIALSSLANFTIPGDTSASSRYWERDIVEPEVTFNKPGKLEVPSNSGIGYNINEHVLRNYLVEEEEFLKEKAYF